MIKYIAIAYTISTASIIEDSQYCEIKSLQSPYVKDIDEPMDSNPLYIPVDTCSIADARDEDSKKALLKCIKTRQNWRKL
jgi:hypothetical protein